MQRFVNRDDAYYEQWTNGSKYGYVARYTQVTLQLILDHLKGHKTLSFPAVNGNGESRWLAWDSDENEGNLSRLEKCLQAHGWHVLREAQREGREGHLWLLLDKPTPAKDLIRLARHFETAAGISSKSIECFPKQANPETLGSALRAPLGIHRKPGAGNIRGWFANVEQDIKTQLEWLSEQPLNPSESVQIFANQLREFDKDNSERKSTIRRSSFEYRQNILELISEKRKTGRDWAAQCPLCAAQGGDNHRDNLRISLDGTKFCCVFGGPGQIHKAKDIIQALIR